ncbi:MAG: TonB-dependent receptor [Bacteroidales bacterium]|nr:TonB-dependent receptor [Bacteroidales bacterium]
MSQNIAPFLKRIRTFLFLSAVVCAFIMVSSPVMYAQTIEVKGTVVAKSDGLPMIGAFVVEQGTTNGTTVDADGAFALRVKEGAVLEISTMGYKTEQVQAVAGRNLEILLVEDTELLDDVVVVGYGVQKKKLVTGATVQVKGDDVAKLNTTSVLGALQSQSPGVNITQTSGFLDQGYKVNIRGLGTTGDSAPLYVIDGVAGGSISALNPSDIESVDVLKDAASAAIYGARAANGVILVTTKKGKEGNNYISYDGYYGFQNLYKIPTSLNAQEFMLMQDEARAMDGLAGNNWENLIGSRLYAMTQLGWEGTKWMKEILNKNAAIQSHAVTFAGGSERSTYSLGLSYMGQDATMGVPGKIPTMNRYNLRLNNDYIVVKKGDLNMLTVGETLNYRYSETKGSFATGGIYWNGVRDALVKSPLMPAYKEDGSYYLVADQYVDGYQWDISNNDDVNPIAYMEYNANGNKSKQHYLQASVFADLQPMKNLHFRTQFGYMMGASSSRSYTPSYELGRISSQAEDKVSQSQSVYNRFTWDNTASYSMNFGEHQVDALAGASIEKWGFGESISASKRNSLFSDLEHAYLDNVPGDPSSTSSISGSPYSQGSLASFFFRANWNYKEKYMVSATIRADGSSNFSRGNRWGIFPSVSAGWVMSNEPFFEPVKDYVDFLKIRASWGQNGNCNVNAFEYLARISIGDGVGQGYPFGDPVTGQSIGAYSSKLTNPDLSWERSEQIDIGLDARFFNSRLAFEFDWYNKETKDWLVTAPVLYSYGTGAAAINGGNVRNRGIEFALRWNDEVAGVRYGVSLNGATNSNKVTKIANADGIIHGASSVPWEGADEIYRAEVGKPMGYFYGYKTAGVFQTQDQIDSYTGALLNGDKTRPGDLIFVDVNKDGKIDADDRTEIGNPHPDFTMGLSFNVEWKGIDLSFTGFGAFGQQIFKCYRDYTTSPLANFTTEIYQRWTGAGSTNRWPRLSSTSNSNWSTISDLYIEDGNYFKIQNITIGYDIAKAFKSFPLQSLRIYVTGQNLYTFTSYSGMDPEIGYADHSWAQGVDLGFYPSSRNILIGVNVKF